MNRYRHAMRIRGELEDLMFDDKVLGTMDIKYKRFIGKEIHIDDHMKIYDECSDIIFEAFKKAEKLDQFNKILSTKPDIIGDIVDYHEKLKAIMELLRNAPIPPEEVPDAIMKIIVQEEQS